MTEKQVRLWVDDKARAEIARGQSLNRSMRDDIARMATFLAADDSDVHRPGFHRRWRLV